MYILNENMFNGMITTDNYEYDEDYSIECLYFNHNFINKNAEIDSIFIIPTN